MGIDPNHARVGPRTQYSRQRSNSDTMITTQYERESAELQFGFHQLGKSLRPSAYFKATSIE